MLLAEDDHMIEALASDRADESFAIAVLPWRSRRCRSVANAHRWDAARKCLAVDPVPITDEIVWRALPTTCLRDSGSGRNGSSRRRASEGLREAICTSRQTKRTEEPHLKQS